MKILVRETNWLGDVILSLPFFDALKDQYPDAGVSVLARPGVASILQNHPPIDRLLLYDQQGMHPGMGGLFAMASGLRDLEFDRAYLLPNSFSSAFMVRLAKIPERIGYATDGRSFLLTRAIKKTSEIKSWHETYTYLHLLGIHPHEIPAPLPRLVLTEQERQKAKELAASLGINKEGRLFGMVPGAAYGTAKRWLEDRYAEVARRLVDEYKGPVLLFGSAAEKDVCGRIASMAGQGVFNLAGKTPLRILAALMQSCQLVISNDTGAMHVSAAVNTPVVAIFGPTNPTTTSPAGQSHVLLRHPVDCSPCLLRHCPVDHRCMKAISVVEVMEVVKKKLG